MDRETWRFINSFAPWFSAFATAASAIVALYLARRGAKVRLRVHCGVRVVGAQGVPRASWEKFLMIRATNVGFREAKIDGIIWQTGFLRKVKYVQIPPANALSTPLPTKLAYYGDEACFLFPLDCLRKLRDPVGEAVRTSRWPQLAVRWVRAGVSTSTGEEYSCRVRRDVQQEIIQSGSKQSA